MRKTNGSQTRSSRKTRGCQQCGESGGCDCCPNWCFICNVAKCRVHRPSKWSDDALNTQYTRDYPPKQSHVEVRVPGGSPLPSMPFYGVTTQRSDYTPKRGRSNSARPADKPIPYSPLDDDTTYNAKYTPKCAELEHPPDAIYPHKTAPFIGASTYDTDYIKKKVRPWTSDPPLPPPRVRLDDSTEYRDEFYRKPILPRSPQSSQPLLPSSHVPTITTYGHDYVPNPFEDRERLDCCADDTHPAGHPWMKAICRERPWTSCSSCADGTCQTAGPRRALAPALRQGRAPIRRQN